MGKSHECHVLPDVEVPVFGWVDDKHHIFGDQWSPLWTCFPWTIGSHRSSQGVWTACTCSARGSPGWSYSSPLCSQTSAPHKEVLHPGDAVVKLVWRPVQLFLQQQQSGPSGHPSLLWMQKHVFDLILKNIIDTVLNPKYQHISFLSNTCSPIHLGARRRNRPLYWRIVWDATKALRWPLWRTWGAMLRTITPNARKPSRVSWIASMCSRPRENGEYSKTHIWCMSHKESSSEYMSTCKYYMSIPNESWLWPVGGEPARADNWTWQDIRIRCRNSGEKRLFKETIGPQPGLAMRIACASTTLVDR